MKNLKLFSSLAAFVAFMVVGCSKGTTGPAGATGPAGPDSVLHSAWTQLSMTMGIDANNDTFYSQNITAAAITQNVLDSDLVLGYISFIDASGAENVFNASEEFEITYTVGNIELIDYLGDLSYDNTGYSFRYIIVPGTILTNSAFKQYTKAQIKTMSYSTVEKLIGTSVTQTSPN
jgi:hypothetical protein